MGTGSESRRARSSTRPGGSGGEDVVQEVPKLIVPLVLASLVTDADAKVYLRKPERMAVASPRVFWSIVRHYGVGAHAGPGTSGGEATNAAASTQSSPRKRFAEAIAEILPGYIDEKDIGLRERLRPERYADYVSHKELNEALKGQCTGRKRAAKKGSKTDEPEKN